MKNVLFAIAFLLSSAVCAGAVDLDSLSRANKAEEKAFMVENKKKKGVKTTVSGVQYIIVKKGGSRRPVFEDEIYVKYRGYMVDGTVFDESLDKPVMFKMNSLIEGMAEAVHLIGVGGRMTMFIPARLAYGHDGPETVGPDKMLIFEVELLDIYNEND